MSDSLVQRTMLPSPTGASEVNYFNFPFQNFSTPPLFYLTFPTPSADPRDVQGEGWHSTMPHDRANTESSSSAASPFVQPHFSKNRNGPSVFGVDPPRPAREGYE